MCGHMNDAEKKQLMISSFLFGRLHVIVMYGYGMLPRQGPLRMNVLRHLESDCGRESSSVQDRTRIIGVLYGRITLVAPSFYSSVCKLLHDFGTMRFHRSMTSGILFVG